MTEIVNYHIITEAPGTKASKPQIEKTYQRYKFAAEIASNKDVLEVGCGTGIGLGYLAKYAKSVVGGDIDQVNIDIAQRTYCESKEIKLLQLDASKLPFPDKSFDLVLLFEAIYYLPNAVDFIKESFRVLRPGGKLMICSVNCEWDDFHPSPFSVKYYDVNELFKLLNICFLKNNLYGGFPVTKGGIVSAIKKFAIKFHLIPGSLKARAYLKRVFVGTLVDMPEIVSENMAPYDSPVEFSPSGVCDSFIIIYSISEK